MNLARSVVISSVLFLLAICLARGLDPAHRISQYGHTAWRIQDGYFGGHANCLSHRRAMGISGSELLQGLLRFDGVQFVPLGLADRESSCRPTMSIPCLAPGTEAYGSERRLVWFTGFASAQSGIWMGSS